MPWDGAGAESGSLGHALLEPTLIYVKRLLALTDALQVKVSSCSVATISTMPHILVLVAVSCRLPCSIKGLILGMVTCGRLALVFVTPVAAECFRRIECLHQKHSAATLMLKHAAVHRVAVCDIRVHNLPLHSCQMVQRCTRGTVIHFCPHIGLQQTALLLHKGAKCVAGLCAHHWRGLHRKPATGHAKRFSL